MYDLKNPRSIKDPHIIEEHAKLLEGKKLSSLYQSDWNRDLYEDKGHFGKLIEEIHFGLTPNNLPQPDFPEARVELKTTGLIEVKKQLRAKERLKLNSLNYVDMDKEQWETSHFLSKNKNLLLIAYLYDENEIPMELMIKLCGLWGIPENDMLIIKSDWEKIKAKINKNIPEQISEGDTMYLGACTSGSDSTPTAKVPRSTRKVKNRSLCFKKPYVDEILWQLSKGTIGKPVSAEKIVKDPSLLEKIDLETLIIRKFDPFIGKSTKEIAKLFKVKLSEKAKNYNDIISKAILGIRRNPKYTEEFEKAGIRMKSVAFEKSGTLKESISFPIFKYDDLILENDWESSPTREMIDKKFFFVIYQKDGHGKRVLKGVKFWNIPANDLDNSVQQVWKETIKRLKNDPKGELPGLRDNPVAHVRPHAQNAKETYITRSGLKLKKYSFWLNAKYIKKQIG